MLAYHWLDGKFALHDRAARSRVRRPRIRISRPTTAWRMADRHFLHFAPQTKGARHQKIGSSIPKRGLPGCPTFTKPGADRESDRARPNMNSVTLMEPSSFRDPAGSLVMQEDRGLRTVFPEYACETLTFLDSPVARNWAQTGRLIATEVLETWKPGAALHLVHPRLFFPSYSWEWTPAQLSAAAELTLDLCEDLVNTGWILKDATPSNVLFDGGKPVFVDLLSV